MLLSQREYGRYRKQRGLPGGSGPAVQKAVRSKRIPTVEGKIDPAVADAAWAKNTRQSMLCQSKPRPEETSEFAAGAVWAMVEIIRRVRQMLPPFLSELALDGMPLEVRSFCKVEIFTSMVFIVEQWAEACIAGSDLGPIDWASFGGDAHDLRTFSDALRARWAGRLTEAEFLDAVDGIEAEACRHA